ncbi:hypothetical protein [Aquimarina rubra]|uniref:Uncharacterized protein n=1 Tax=Aquimarina rubra TaxID=1920033 RepID=A0ABW5LD07_9FLAO
MSVKHIRVHVGNNLNAIVKDGKNVDAVVTFKPKDALPYSTPQIGGGVEYQLPNGLGYNSHELDLTISVRSNTLGDAETMTVIPLNANDLYVNLEGTYNGAVDIQTAFK